VTQAEINGWTEVAILLLVNVYLVFVLLRVMRWAKAQQGGGSILFVNQPWKADCRPHSWQKEKYIDAKKEEVHVLYCTECGLISGSNRYFRKEAIDYVNEARKNGTQRRDS